MNRHFAILGLAALVFSAAIVDRVKAQPAPVPRAVVPAEAAPEAMAPLFSRLSEDENQISIDGAQWLQLRFSDYNLGPDGTLTISSPSGESQTFRQEQLESWEGLTAMFGGSELTITLTPGDDAPGEPVSATVGEIIIGLPAGAANEGMRAAPDSLRNLLGGDPGRFIPDDPPRQPEQMGIESICGAADDRVASNHPLTGRIVPIGCTGWIIQGGAFLTAGHCIGAGTQIVEFNVGPSQPDGTTVPSATRDQYRVVSGSIVSAFTGIGNDWAMFNVLPNTETGLMPMAAQGGAFELSDTANPANVRITGYGVDGPAPNFGNPPPRNADNQTQQTHTGALTENSVAGPNSATLRYTTDTQGGNSGSPVVVEGGTNVAIGIHTNGGCGLAGGANAGTSFRNQGLWAAVGGGGEWGGWENLGGIILEEPECVSWGANRIDCFARGTNAAMFHRWWNGSSWGGWENLGGVILDSPECVGWGTNRIDCFARGTNRAMFHRWWNGSSWGGWENLGGVILDKPNCVSWGPNRIDCFARGTNRAMFHRWWNGSSWGGWENLGGVILDEPNCVSWGPNRIDCFARGTDRAMYHRWWNGSSWGGWENLGGVLTTRPDCVSWGPNRIDCFARGTNGAMWHRWWNGSSWGGWENLGGIILEEPNCVAWGPNRIDCFARGLDEAMFHRWWDGSSWNGWENLGGVIMDRPECVSWGSNRIDCFGRGLNGAMWHRWFPG